MRPFTVVLLSAALFFQPFVPAGAADLVLSAGQEAALTVPQAASPITAFRAVGNARRPVRLTLLKGAFPSLPPNLKTIDLKGPAVLYLTGSAESVAIEAKTYRAQILADELARHYTDDAIVYSIAYGVWFATMLAARGAL